MIKGKGVFFHPPISVIDDGEEQDRKQPTIPKTRTIKFSQTKEDIQIIVTTDGFLGLIMNGTDDEIIELINVLITTTMLNNQRSLIVSEYDLCDFKYDLCNQKITITANQVFSLRNRFEFERDNDNTYSLWAQIPRNAVLMKVIPGIFDKAYDIYKNKELRNYVLLLGVSWGLSYEKLFKASFLYSWIIIENRIKNYISKYIDSLEKLEPENKILKNNTKNISQSIKLLHKLNKIDDDTFNSLKKLRGLRNKIVHDITTKINTNETKNCMDVAKEIIFNKLMNYQVLL